MSNNYEPLSVRKNVKELVLKDCVKEFLRTNPDFKGMNITQSFIIERIALSYLDRL